YLLLAWLSRSQIVNDKIVLPRFQARHEICISISNKNNILYPNTLGQLFGYCHIVSCRSVVFIQHAPGRAGLSIGNANCSSLLDAIQRAGTVSKCAARNQQAESNQ